MAMSRSLGATLVTSRPPMLISPPLTRSSPAIMRRSVDFPHPDGPTKTTNSPSSISISTPWSTSTGPKDFLTARIATAAMALSSVILVYLIGRVEREEGTMNEIDLKNRVAIITGGARGIGFAVAQRFVRSGAKVAIWDLTGAAEAAAKLGGARGFSLDITNGDRVSAALAASEAELGPIAILVTSAGITGPNTPVESYPIEAWRQVIDVDLTGV